MNSNTGREIIDVNNPKRSYIELEDGYRLIFEDGLYTGRYNPELDSVI